MNLGSIFANDKSNLNISKAQVSGISSSEHSPRTSAVIAGLTPGQTIRGEVIGKSGNVLTISIDNDIVINARLGRDMNVSSGQTLSFEVLSNNSDGLALSPLFANMTNEATILKALSNANLSPTVQNMEMINSMMKEGMSIDRETVLNVSRALTEFPNNNPSIQIQMIQMGIPLSEDNILQFESYLNMNHELIDAEDEIVSQMPVVFNELMAEGREPEALGFYNDIISVFMDENFSDTEIMQGESEKASVNPYSDAEAKMITLPKEYENANHLAGSVENGQIEPANPGEMIVSNILKDTSVLNDYEFETLANLMEEAGTDEETATHIASGDFGVKDILSEVKELIADRFNELGGISREVLYNPERADALHRLLASDSFNKILGESVVDNWTIKPEEFAQKQQTEKLYERIKQQTDSILNVLEKVGKSETILAGNVKNMSANIDFINQINNMYTYVQMPLKMAGNKAHGDLYVYTNKKNLAKKDGSVSALLHLDMQHLGPMDVYVKMAQGKVSTNFMLKNESAMDLIEDNLHILTKRLCNRGYDVSCKVTMKDEADKSIIETIKEQSGTIPIISDTAFDVRA